MSAPSFIYPADYVTNTARIGPFVDEVELLFFESAAGCFPSAAQLDQLSALAAKLDITYNIHLPLDLDLGNLDAPLRHRAAERMAEILGRVTTLHATTHTLHLPFSDTHRNPSAVLDWQARTGLSLAELLRHTRIAPQRISIETLDYPPQWFEPLVHEFNLSVCADIGHLELAGLDLESVLACFGPKIRIMHLHGVADGRDHQSLAHLAPGPRTLMQRYLQDFDGCVSLEVFSLSKLDESLACLDQMLSG